MPAQRIRKKNQNSWEHASSTPKRMDGLFSTSSHVPLVMKSERRCVLIVDTVLLSLHLELSFTTNNNILNEKPSVIIKPVLEENISKKGKKKKMKILYESNLSVVVPPQFPWIIVISIERRWKRWMLLRDKRRQHTHTHMPPPPPERGRAPQHWAESGMANVMDARVQNRETVGGAYIGSSSLNLFPRSTHPMFFFFVFLLIYGVSTHRPQGKSATL